MYFLESIKVEKFYTEENKKVWFSYLLYLSAV